MTQWMRSVAVILTVTCSVIAVAQLPAAQAQAASYHDIEDADVDQAVSDPLESFNRSMYGFNNVLDKILFKPVVKVYRFIVPEMGRKGVHNVVRNLSEPVTLVNAVLQGDVNRSFTTFWRFTLNSTFGIAGLFDVVEHEGLPYRKEDFGQTLGVYGADAGPYLVLPILGPSSGRDVVGSVADMFMDPLNYIGDEGVIIARTSVRALDAKDNTVDAKEEMERLSLDPYSALRSLYLQKRQDEIRNGSVPEKGSAI